MDDAELADVTDAGGQPGVRRPGLAAIFGGVAGAAILAAAAATAIAARRSGISVRAWALTNLVSLMAPDMSSESAITEAIAKDRARNPAPPPKRLLKTFGFADDGTGPQRRFRTWRHNENTGPLRLLYLHGGGYVLELQAVQWNLVTGLLKRVGGEVLTPIYPLAPEQGWEDGLAAVRQAYLDLAASAGAKNVVIVGDSAGGGLALALAQTLRDAGEELPAALVLFSPWLDVGVTGADQPELERRDPALSIAFLRWAGRKWAKNLPIDDPRISPLFGQHHGLPPTIVFSGTRDVLDSDALRLAAANPEISFRHYPEMMHDWPLAPIPEATRALDEAADFIRRAVPV